MAFLGEDLKVGKTKVMVSQFAIIGLAFASYSELADQSSFVDSLIQLLSETLVLSKA